MIDVIEPARVSGEDAELALGRVKAGRYRILTLRQPWAWLVVFAGKDVENRSWATSFRGPILIHAGKQMFRREYKTVHEYAWKRHGIEIPAQDELMFGAVIGIAELVDIVPPEAVDPKTGERRRWHLRPDELPSNKPQFGWLLRDITPVEPIYCQGAQGLQWYDVPEAA